MKSYGWIYKEIRTCDPFIRLSGESKIIIDNVINYLERIMNDDEKKAFADGDYTLEKYKMEQEQKKLEEAKKKNSASQTVE